MTNSSPGHHSPNAALGTAERGVWYTTPMTDTTDRSYGIIPLRRQGEDWEVLLIHQYSRIGGNSYWVFPKGHPEPNETPELTARRELREETGLTVDRLVAEPTFTLEYRFTFEGKSIEKQVVFFLGLVPDGQSLRLEADEVREAKWYPLAEAYERLDYQNTKEVFQRVVAFLRTVENLENI